MFKKLIILLTRHERKRAGLLMGMIIVMAFLDTLGVASILPFMAVLSDPGLVQDNPVLSTAFIISRRLGIHSTEEFLFALGGMVFVLLITSLSFKAIVAYVQIRFALMQEYSIGRRLVEGYLRQPYSWFLDQSSADLGKNILSEVQKIVEHGMIPFMVLMAQSAIALALLILLIIVDPVLALSVGLVLGAAYGAIFAVMSGRLKRLGQARIEANKKRFTAVTEAFGGAKEVKVGGLEHSYIQRFQAPAKRYAQIEAHARLVTQIPRYVLEVVAFGGLLLVILYLMARSGSFSSALPILALYAFAGYRLMPALQQIYSAVTQLRFVSPALDALHKDLDKLEYDDVQKVRLSPLPLNNSITLEQVSYRYPNNSHWALKDINITIIANSRVGFVGPTGSGKTTLVDVILGLLEPQEGTLQVDNKNSTST
jgi:ABC-type bacteriocin/lantibiotic exporter with double-glycine peptidase domain